MSPVRTAIAVAIFVSLAPTTGASADPSDAPNRAEERTSTRGDGGHTHDYSRFSDGPRRVPTPRGASLARAQRLGLGTRATATRLLNQRPDPAWVQAAGSELPDRLLWPITEGRYVRGFGFVRTTRPDLLHKGVDISEEVGTVVRAAADGIVAYSDNGIRGMGNCVILVHPNGWVTLYAHNSRTTVQPGWRVQRGERIALLGSTGISRGPHVHFELRHRGRPINPLALFDGGPAFVRRAAAQAARLGNVPPPQALSADDRAAPEPLAAWGELGSGDASEAGTTRGRATEPAAIAAVFGRTPLGSRALVRRLLRFAPTEQMRAQAGGRVFSNLLWPLRGGRVVAESASRRRLLAQADEGTAVRAAADGLVVFAGRLPGRGESVVLLHQMGWVTVYSALGTNAATVGESVVRGEWIGHLGARKLRFEMVVEGRRQNPMPSLVRIPSE